jgi:uncharacterized protein YggT (Ycf19 family)
MEAIFYVIAKVISLFLSAVSLAMGARIIMEFVSRISSYDIQENKSYIFLYAVTELFVTPFRYICYKFNLFTSTPIDVPFMMAYISVIFLNGLLPII